MTTSQCTNNMETSKNAQKEKKKSRRNQKKNQKNSTLVIRVKTTDILKQRLKKSDRDMAKIKYYCCNNKDNYTNKCLKIKN